LTKAEKEASELALEHDMSLKHMKAPIGVTAVWYKNNDNDKDQWMYYTSNWTLALKRLKGTKKCKKKKAPPRKRKRQ